MPRLELLFFATDGKNVPTRRHRATDTENPLKFARQIGIHCPLAATNDLTRKFGGIEGPPTTFFYDRKEILQKKIIEFEYTELFPNGSKRPSILGACGQNFIRKIVPMCLSGRQTLG